MYIGTNEVRPMLFPRISGAYFRESAMPHWPRIFSGAVFLCIRYAPEFRGRTFLTRLCPPKFSGAVLRVFGMPPEFRVRSFVKLLCPRICDSVIYFIHQMAMHNTTKLLPLTNQTKLTLTVKLTLTDTVTVICLHSFR